MIDADKTNWIDFEKDTLVDEPLADKLIKIYNIICKTLKNSKN